MNQKVVGWTVWLLKDWENHQQNSCHSSGPSSHNLAPNVSGEMVGDCDWVCLTWSLKYQGECFQSSSSSGSQFILNHLIIEIKDCFSQLTQLVTFEFKRSFKRDYVFRRFWRFHTSTKMDNLNKPSVCISPPPSITQYLLKAEMGSIKWKLIAYYESIEPRLYTARNSITCRCHLLT